MRVLVLGAAPQPDPGGHYRRLIERAETIVAADAAAEWCVSLGRVPDVAVGDFDSAEPDAPARLAALGVRVVSYPAEKDFSDLDLALDEARRLGATVVTFAAVTAERLDHTLAALGTLVSAADLLATLDEPQLAAWVLDAKHRPSVTLTGRPGDLVSLIAAGGEAGGVTLEGMRYPLTDATLRPLSSLALSNELASPPVRLSIGSGQGIVIASGVPGDRAEAT